MKAEGRCRQARQASLCSGQDCYGQDIPFATYPFAQGDYLPEFKGGESGERFAALAGRSAGDASGGVA